MDLIIISRVTQESLKTPNTINQRNSIALSNAGQKLHTKGSATSKLRPYAIHI